MRVLVNITFVAFIKALYEKVVFVSGVIYHLKLTMVGVWVNKVNFGSTGVIKSQNVIQYWNLYHVLEKRGVFLIASVHK